MTSTPAPPPRIVFIDVDGTILDHSGVIAPSTVAAIRTARAHGHLVYLCTGRSDGDIHPDVRAIGIDGAITNGGAYAMRGDEVVLARPMPRADVEHLVSYFTDHGMQYFLQTHERVFATTGIRDLMSAFTQQRADLRRAEMRKLGIDDADEQFVDTLVSGSAFEYPDVAGADLDEVAKAVFISPHSDSLDRAQADLGDRFHVVPGSMPMPGGSNGEIAVNGVNKGSAIIAVLDLLGIDATDAIGVGDSWNDIEMFEVVGTAVAMGNADPEMKARADRVTTDVLDDGVWNAFVQLGLV